MKNLPKSQLLKDRPLSNRWRVETHNILSSTQDTLRARAPEVPGLVVQALSQSGGQGRQGRAWQSPPSNLYMSVLLETGGEAPGEMAFVAALAVYETAKFFKAQDLVLKWPNDVLAGGKKLAGILIEHLDGKLLVGIGVNVQNPPEIGIGLSDVSVDAVRDTVLDHLGEFYDLWQQAGFEPIRDLWLARAHKTGTLLKSGGVEGVFENIDPDGALLLRDSQNKQHRITAGDVNLVIEQ